MCQQHPRVQLLLLQWIRLRQHAAGVCRYERAHRHTHTLTLKNKWHHYSNTLSQRLFTLRGAARPSRCQCYTTDMAELKYSLCYERTETTSAHFLRLSLCDSASDHNECEEESCVGGVCVNTVGSYYCSCPPPLVLDSTQRNCVNSSDLNVGKTPFFLLHLVFSQNLRFSLPKMKVTIQTFSSSHGLLNG